VPKRPVLRYFGGKWLLGPWIISKLPPHNVYVEPFGGAASVLMRKPRSYAEVYNDLCGEIVGLFRVLQDRAQADELERRLRLTPFARDEFNLAYEPAADPIEKSRRLIIRAYMGFGSGGHSMASPKTGFRANSNRSGTTPAHDWANFPDEIKEFTARLAGVVIENRDAIEVMKQQDSEDTLHFLDPPYVHATRGTKHSYNFEMTNDQHAELCEFIKTLKGMVILCGYENKIYESLGWAREARVSLADGARERKEILWFNPAAERAQAQTSFKLDSCVESGG
jgi:DNA adenine methylase